MTWNATIPLICFGFAVVAQAQEHRIEYRWLNQPCGEVINCDAGCSACNMPEGGDAVLFGTNAAFLGVVTCPLPLTPGDNAVFSAGWPAAPEVDKTVVISGIAVVPVHIDSIVFRHAIYANGPQRLKVEFTNSAANPSMEIADVEIPSAFTDVVLTDLGCVEFQPGGPLGTFQIRFTPYDGGDGGWALDEVRIVATACETGQVGVVEYTPYSRTSKQGPWFDLMGRPMGEQPERGVYINGARRVRVF